MLYTSSCVTKCFGETIIKGKNKLTKIGSAVVGSVGCWVEVEAVQLANAPGEKLLPCCALLTMATLS